MRTNYKHLSCIRPSRFCKGVFNHLRVSNEIEEPNLDEFEDVLSVFFSAVGVEDAEEVEWTLGFVSDALANSVFEPTIWKLLLDSNIIQYLATQLPGEWPGSLIVAMLNCLSNILLFPPEAYLEQIRERYPQDDFIRPLLDYNYWINSDLRFPYVLILSRLTRLYGASSAPLLEHASRLARDLSDKNPEIITVEAVGSTMIDYLAQRYSGATEEESIPMVFIQEYMRRATSNQIRFLPPAALCSLFQGITAAIHHFPQWCDCVYRASFVTIDRDIQQHAEFYPALRESLLNWIAELARWRPGPLKWNIELLTYFGDPDAPDQGRRALEITTLVFNRLWGNHKRFPAQRFCDYGTMMFQASSFAGKRALFACLSAFFDKVAIPADWAVCTSFARDIMPGLHQMMTEDFAEDLDTCTITEDLKRSVCQLLDSFVKCGIFTPKDFIALSWYEARPRNPEGNPRDDAGLEPCQQTPEDRQDTSHSETQLGPGGDGMTREHMNDDILKGFGDRIEPSAGGLGDCGAESGTKYDAVGFADEDGTTEEHEGEMKFEEEDYDDAEESGTEDDNMRIMNEDEERPEEEEADEMDDDTNNSVSGDRKEGDELMARDGDAALEMFTDDSSEDSEFDLNCMTFKDPWPQMSDNI
jgi:hypothetical protein